MMVLPTRHTELPGSDEGGEVREWVIPSNDGGDAETTYVRFKGRLLGAHASRPRHKDRWFEVRIFRVIDEDGRVHYIVHRTGATRLPGEIDLFTVDHAYSASEVLEILVTRGEDRPVRFTIPAARCISQATRFDADLEQAWLDRAVV